MTTIVVEFKKGTTTRASIEGEGLGRAFAHLIQRNRRRYGGYIVHAGLVVMFIGFAGAAYEEEIQAALIPGESADIQSPFGHTYTLTYEAMSWDDQPNLERLIASLRVVKDGSQVGVITAQQRFYANRPESNVEVGILRAWNEDLYVILAGIDDVTGAANGTNPRPLATFRILVNPLVPWIWTGGMIVALGTLIAMWPAAPTGQLPAEGRVAGRPGAQGRREEELAEV
jgi:cytochrome c-type biogenesis protein CcmF